MIILDCRDNQLKKVTILDITLKASSGEHFVPRNFVLHVALLNIERNIETKSGTVVSSGFFFSDSIIRI